MGVAHAFTPEKLVIPTLISNQDVYTRVRRLLVRRYGPIDYESRQLEFTYTQYYDREMGSTLKRVFFAFKRLISPARLAGIKCTTNRIERKFSENGNRRINLDPGLICLSRLILASTKDGSHRIPLTRGIYGEITLVYQGGHYRSLDWTYPDYRTAQYREILSEIRQIYSIQLKQ
jgi:hypothetical protein